MAHDTEGRLRGLLRRVARDLRYRDDDRHIAIRSITSGGANYTSTLHLATLSTPGLPDLELFAKVASIGVKIRSRSNVDSLYHNEQVFYNRLAKIWDGYQEKYRIPQQHRFLFPEYYGGSPELGRETVILENLVANGYVSYDRFKSVDWEFASKAVEVLAKFHALSFVFRREDPGEFATMTNDMQFSMPEVDQASQGLWTRMVGGAMAVVNEQQQEKIKRFFEQSEGQNLFKKYHMPTHTPILTHGDYRPSNLLYKRQDDGSLQIIALDYQTIHTGCPVEDLVYFIFMGSDEEFRKNYYHQLIEHYYLQLGLALRRFKINVEEVYERKFFDEDLKQMLKYALVMGVVVLPVVTVEAESAPKVDADSDIDSFLVAPNVLYASRFRGLMNDLTRWGVL